LPRLPQVPQGRHPIILEIWRVQNGLIQVGGLDAHDLWEIAGSSAGLGVGGSAGAVLGAGLGGAAGAAAGGTLGIGLGPLGWWWGAAAGAVAGSVAGAGLMAAEGAVRGAHWAAAMGRKTSENNSRMVGTYNEIIVTVPCCYEQAGRARDFTLVLAAYTDSAASLLGEWLVGWGYRKSRASGTWTEDGALEVMTGSTGPPLRIISRAAPPMPASAVYSAATHVITAQSHPLLGLRYADRLVVSFLDRAFEEQTMRLTPASVRLESGDAFIPGLSGAVSDISPIGDTEPWGAFIITGLPVTLSYPRALAE
jgi:hypothetical protein